MRGLDTILHSGVRHPVFYFRPDGFGAIPLGLRLEVNTPNGEWEEVSRGWYPSFGQRQPPKVGT